MKKISLEDPIRKAYRSAGDDVLCIKSAVIALYSDFDRHFLKQFEIKLGMEIAAEQFEKTKPVFPCLAKMTLQQFNSLLETVARVRNVNAHLFLNKNVQLNEDVESYLQSVCPSQFAVTNNHNLTVYGQAYIAMFLCLKYNIFSFATSFFKGWLKEFDGYKGDDLSEFQINFQHNFQKYCGVDKPIFNDTTLPKIDVTFMNDLFKRNMPKFVFSAERAASTKNKDAAYTSSFKTLMEKACSNEGQNDAIRRFIILRNCWLHGTNLFDYIEYNGDKICFDYQFMIKSLVIIKKWMLDQPVNFAQAIRILTKFGQACFNYYALRLVEVSHKLLDNRLLTEEKINSRALGSMLAYSRLLDSPRDFLELAEELIGVSEIDLRLQASKFVDGKVRRAKYNRLLIVNMHSEKGFQIGKYHTEQTDLALTLIDLPEDFQNKVNGNYVKEYFKNPGKKISSRIVVSEINLH